MIKFFRKIRQNLITENKVSKYLLYGIGEIVLVVIGILIAVQLNNKNEFRKQKLVEIDILKGIRSDILLDTVDLNSNIRVYKNVIKNDSSLLDYFIKKKELRKGLANALRYSANSDWLIVLHDSHFQEAKQKGLSIISNDSLRDRINRLYEFDYKALILVENNFESYNYSKILREEIGQYFEYDSTGVHISESSYEKLLYNKNSLYHLYDGMQTKRTLLWSHESVLKSVLNISENINKEIMKLEQ